MHVKGWHCATGLQEPHPRWFEPHTFTPEHSWDFTALSSPPFCFKKSILTYQIPPPTPPTSLLLNITCSFNHLNRHSFMQFTAACRTQVKGKEFFQNKGEAILASCNCNQVLGTGREERFTLMHAWYRWISRLKS